MRQGNDGVGMSGHSGCCIEAAGGHRLDASFGFNGRVRRLNRAIPDLVLVEVHGATLRVAGFEGRGARVVDVVRQLTLERQ